MGKMVYAINKPDSDLNQINDCLSALNVLCAIARESMEQTTRDVARISENRKEVAKTFAVVLESAEQIARKCKRGGDTNG